MQEITGAGEKQLIGDEVARLRILLTHHLWPEDQK